MPSGGHPRCTHPRDHQLWAQLLPWHGLIAGLGLAGPRKDCHFSPCIHCPGLAPALGTLGVQGLALQGQSLGCCHLLSVTDRLSPAASSPPELVALALLVHPACPCCCQLEGPSCTSCATRALGTWYHLCSGAAAPCRGVSHRVFHTLAPAVFPLYPQLCPCAQSHSPCCLPSLLASPPGSAAAVPPFCCVPLLVLALIAQHLAPAQEPLVLVSCQWLTGGPWRADGRSQCHRAEPGSGAWAAGASCVTGAGSAPPFCRGSCCLGTCSSAQSWVRAGPLSQTLAFTAPWHGHTLCPLPLPGST